jgi:signal transduction histidine kinase
MDKPRIEQVLYNLIINGLNHVGKDKILIIRLSDLGNSSKVEVIDHGSGIAPDEIKRIWERYYKSANRKQSAPTGTGLGLSIVKGILELHKAKYGVETQLNSGSTFWFILKK